MSGFSPSAPPDPLAAGARRMPPSTDLEEGRFSACRPKPTSPRALRWDAYEIATRPDPTPVGARSASGIRWRAGRTAWLATSHALSTVS